MWKFCKRLGFVVAITLALGAAGMAYALPSAAAAVCPACYGFQDVGNRVYVQRQTTAQERAAIVGIVDAARERLTQFWGPLRATPRVFVCSDDACFRRLGGGGRRGMSLFDQVAVLSPRGNDAVIAAHELSMNELHHRIGLWAFARGRVPIWFNEGVAMVSSDDLRYLAPADQADRCLVAGSAPLPVGMFEWNRLALSDRRLYAKAACQTSRWMASHGGASGVVALVEKVGAGDTFENASQ